MISIYFSFVGTWEYSTFMFTFYSFAHLSFFPLLLSAIDLEVGYYSLRTFFTFSFLFRDLISILVFRQLLTISWWWHTISFLSEYSIIMLHLNVVSGLLSVLTALRYLITLCFSVQLHSWSGCTARAGREGYMMGTPHWDIVHALI